ncbi:hypothetical protein ACYOEI_08105 [Singulisphaera rosea]
MESESRPFRGLSVLILVLIAIVALATRLPAPWRVEVINDEMYHLESWMRHYRTDDIAPLFHRQIAAMSSFSPERKAWLEHLYQSSPLVQRLVCVKNDYGSFGFSVAAEIIEYFSHSNLVVLRLPAVAFALGTILLAYYLGTLLKDRELGLWIAALVTVAPLTQTYAGLGRPHGLTQFALFLLIVRYVLERSRGYASPWRFLLAALFAQTTHLTCWATVGLFVISELIRRLLNGTSIVTLIKQTWWYAVVSVGFLVVIKLNSIGTSFFSANTIRAGASKIWRNFCLASPFGHLAGLGDEGLWASGILYAILIALGIIALFVQAKCYKGLRWPLLAVFVVTTYVPFVASNEVRHQMIYGVAPLILAGIGGRWAFRGEKLTLGAVAALVLGLGGLSLVSPIDPYQSTIDSETRYSVVSSDLGSMMKPGDVWISWPYFVGIPLALYGHLDAPVLPLNEPELDEAVRTRSGDHACYVFTNEISAQTTTALQGAEILKRYSNGLVLLKLPTKPSDPAPAPPKS